jgi:hypothetical protein
MRALLAAALVSMLLLGVTVPAAAVPPARRCTAPTGVTRFKVAMPNTARAIRRGEALIIVAIGSSSTEGIGASDQAHTYPVLRVAVFQRFAMMRHWVTSGKYRMEEIISRDQLHMNDASYHCIALLLADSLADAALATVAQHR